MNWFEQLTGFTETHYDQTRSQLEVCGQQLRSSVNGQSYAIGSLELVSLRTLRERVQADSGGPTGRLQASLVQGDVRRMHQLPENKGALFQVASQFNLLEMTSPSVTPEQGVTRYAHDHTQGPACAVAAGAATIYRNYFVPVGPNQIGQTRTHQLDALADVGQVLSTALGLPVAALWSMENGYALCSPSGLQAIADYLAGLSDAARDALAARLCIGLHQDVEVTDAPAGQRPLVSQAFCSALPVAYSRFQGANWQPFATLILQAAYEATLWAAVLNARRGASNVVLLTRLGGGAFGNNDDWIHAAMTQALRKAAHYALQVRLVSYGPPSSALKAMAKEFA